MIHPAALIESGDWSSVDPDVAFKAGVRHQRQAAVVNAALEYSLIAERYAAGERRRGLTKPELMKACDELLKLVPVDTHRPHPSKRRRA